MDDLRLSLRALGHHVVSQSEPATENFLFRKQTKKAVTMVVAAHHSELKEPDPLREEDVHLQSLSLKSIHMGLPSLDAKAKTKFYSLMRMSSSLEKRGVSSDLPGSPKKSKGSKLEAAKRLDEEVLAVPPAQDISKSKCSINNRNNDKSARDPSPAPRPATTAQTRRYGAGITARRPITAAAAAAAAAAAQIREPPRETLDTRVGPDKGDAIADPNPVATFSRLHRDLSNRQRGAAREESLMRLQLMQSADHMISHLPLTYLYSKPELRHYALERAVGIFYKLSLKKATEQCARALAVWRNPPAIVMSEMQVGFMVIAKRLERLLHSALRVKFRHWSACYSAKFALQRDKFRVAMVTEIQRWFRTLRITRREPFQKLMVAVRLCIHRRKALKYAIEFEKERRAAAAKILRTVVSRRRRHYAARSIMRVRRWLKCYKKTMWKLTRVICTRRLQRWWRMILCRPEKDRAIIRFIVSIGGSRVQPRIPRERHEYLRDGLIESINKLASILQKAWLTSKGLLALFHEYAAKRAREEYEKMLNDNAAVIQQNFRGHLWNLLCAVAVIHNRARRIQRGYRAYQYRCWAHVRDLYHFQRQVRKIQGAFRRFRTKRVLQWRFKARKSVLIFTRARRGLSANIIQRCYRDYKERERIRKELLRSMIASMRSKADLVVKCVSKIQRNWRQLKNSGKYFPKHVRLIIEGHVRRRRNVLFMAARTIQKRAKIFIPKQRKQRKRMLVRKANVIWLFAKAYLLKLAIFDRVMAVHLRQRLASNVMKKNFRRFAFRRKIVLRWRIRGVQRLYRIFVNQAATYIQRWLRRKYAEYYVVPMRKAARLNLAKKREVELARRSTARVYKAAVFVARFFRQFPPWRRFLRRLTPERIYYIRRKAAKKMQRFARRVVAWARFDRVVAYKKKAIALQIIDALYGDAVNVIGWYYKRYREVRREHSSYFIRTSQFP